MVQPSAPEGAHDNTDYRVPSAALIPALAASALDRAASWAGLEDGERRRRAMAAAATHDTEALAALADAYLTLHARPGARVSAHTRRAYSTGVRLLVAAWRGQQLLRPARDAARLWLRHLEASGASPSTVRVRLAAGRTLYRALRWARATTAEPFDEARAGIDTTAPWDKRQPYSDADVTALSSAADALERVIVLLGAHAGLRVAEMCDLAWSDTTTSITVRSGKGGKRRMVAPSRSLQAALDGLCKTRGYIMRSDLPNAVIGLGPDGVRHRMRRLCRRAGVAYRGVHALRHACGTRLVRDGASIEDAARHLGHSSTETTRIYVHWSNEGLSRRLADW